MGRQSASQPAASATSSDAQLVPADRAKTDQDGPRAITPINLRATRRTSAVTRVVTRRHADQPPSLPPERRATHAHHAVSSPPLGTARVDAVTCIPRHHADKPSSDRPTGGDTCAACHRHCRLASRAVRSRNHRPRTLTRRHLRAQRDACAPRCRLSNPRNGAR